MEYFLESFSVYCNYLLFISLIFIKSNLTSSPRKTTSQKFGNFAFPLTILVHLMTKFVTYCVNAYQKGPPLNIMCIYQCFLNKTWRSKVILPWMSVVQQTILDRPAKPQSKLRIRPFGRLRAALCVETTKAP